ncbi:MAG: methylmalonic aciduria and homocystinuria type D protein [Crocosphaera sp.]
MLEINPIIAAQETAKLPMEIYVKPMTKFMLENLYKLLPECNFYPKTVVIILLYSPIPIDSISQQVQEEKQRLKEEFLKLANNIKLTAQQKKYFIDIIDPQDGKPINSGAGTINFDIIAVVHDLLGFSFQNTNDGCKVLNHPIQKSAIYPSIFLSDATLNEMNFIIKKYLKINASQLN